MSNTDSSYITRSRQLAQARVAGYITQAEYREYRDFYLGLSMLDARTDNSIPRRLWTDLELPVGER